MFFGTDGSDMQFEPDDEVVIVEVAAIPILPGMATAVYLAWFNAINYGSHDRRADLN